VVPVTEPEAALSELEILVGVQLFAVQDSVEKAPVLSQTTVPEPEYPISHATTTLWPVVPVTEPEAALSELEILVGVQLFALHPVWEVHDPES